MSRKFESDIEKEKYLTNTDDFKTVGQNIPHESAADHIQGSSEYVDDAPVQRNELFVGIFGSPIANGKLTDLDISAAKNIDGVFDIYTYKDLPRDHDFGPILRDQPLLVRDQLKFIGEPIALIAADSIRTINLAKQHIKVSYEEQTPVLTIDDAVNAKDFLAQERIIQRGDCEQGFQKSELIIEGTFETGGQDHFYLESQASQARPADNGRMEITSSTQHPSELQHWAADYLNLPYSKITAIVKRMGGGFGGKESQSNSIAVMAALVTYHSKRPARIIFDKDEDMQETGKRHAVKFIYKAGFSKDGQIQALQVQVYSNGGAYADLSTAILERTLFHCDNAYYIPNAEFKGRICRTNLPPNTAFRGFGGPQGAALIENIIEKAACTLQVDAFDLRSKNCYGIKENNTTPYGQTVENNMLPSLFQSLAKSTNYKKRLAEIKTFNDNSKTHLKGLAITPTKFGISFTTKFLNQGNALVNFQLDGSIQVSTGATEMGQGVNTKIQQVVADAFQVLPNRVEVMTTSTEKNPNTSPTAASSGSDINCSAALIACEEIKQKLFYCAHAYFEKSDQEVDITANINLSNYSFDDGHVIHNGKSDLRVDLNTLGHFAHMNRVHLGATGYYRTPKIHFDKETGQGRPFLYFTMGAAFSEVTIDRFTGDVCVDDVDILMDLGRLINPGIDYGQVCGGFIQGMGWVTTEELRYDPKGHLLSHSPTTYKIPNIQDTPRKFNIKFIENPDNTLNVKGSKAVGEPPFLLGISVWCAIKNALNHLGQHDLNIPATNEAIGLRLNQLESH